MSNPYFTSLLSTRADHKLDATPVTPSEIDVSTTYEPSEDGSYGAEVIKDVMAASVSSLSEEDISDSSASELGDKEKEATGFVDPFPEFQWMTTEEPHRSRRMAILKAHPEVSNNLLLTIPVTLSSTTTDMVDPQTDGSNKMDFPPSPPCPFRPTPRCLHSALHIPP